MFNIKSALIHWLFVVVFMLSPIYSAIGQDDFASLQKNINYRAKLLNHSLNKTKDSLILSSSHRMYRLYSVGNTKININEEINDFEYKLPLRPLKIGRYVMVTQFNGLRVVFELNILQRAPYSQDLASNLENIGVLTTDTIVETDEIVVVLKDPIIKYRPYNLTDLNREGMQSREECRLQRALQRDKLHAEIKKRRISLASR